MKNHYFTFILFRQGVRLTRLPGLILLISVLAFSLLQAISGYIRITHDHNLLTANNSSYLFLITPAAVSIFATVGPLILTLGAFSFLRKRRSSDFYHSIPVNRICLFFSYALSIIAWTFVIILMGSLASSAVYLFGGLSPSGSITLSYLMLIVKLLGSSLSVICCTLLVMSITSTLFSNLFMTAILLYLPNFVLSLYTITLASAVGNIIPLSTGGITSGYPLYAIYSLLDTPYYITHGISGLGMTGLADWKPILSQFVLTLFYFGLALLLFVRRKSEMAGHGATAPLLQHICRVAVTLPFIAYYPVAFLAPKYFNLFALITFGILAFIVYFSYELIVTRRFASLLKAAPVFLVVVGIAALSSLGLYGAKYNILSFFPNPKQVKSIEVSSGSTSYYSGYYNTYTYSNTSNIPIKDKTAIKVVCDALKGNLIDINARNNSSSGTLNTSYEEKQSIKVEFHTGIFSKTRIITLSKDEVKNLLIKCSETNDKFKKAVMTMPKDDEIISVRYSGSSVNMNMEDALELYQIYRDECKSLSVEQLLNLRDTYYSNSLSEVGYLSISGQRMGGSFSASYHLSNSLTPKTCAAIGGLRYKSILKNMKDALENLNNRKVSFNISNSENSFNFVFNNKDTSSQQSLTTSDFNSVKKIVYDVLDRAIKSGGNGVWNVSVNYDEGNEQSIYANLTENEIKTLAGIANKDAISKLKKMVAKADEYGVDFHFSKQSDDFYIAYKGLPSSGAVTKKDLEKATQILYKAFEHPTGPLGRDSSDTNYWYISVYPRTSSDLDASSFESYPYFTDNDMKFFHDLSQKCENGCN